MSPQKQKPLILIDAENDPHAFEVLGRVENAQVLAVGHVDALTHLLVPIDPNLFSYLKVFP